MKPCRCRKGVVLITVLVMTGVCAIVLGGVLGYVSNATRMTSVHLGNSACRLAAQSEIEIAKAAINENFNNSIARGAHIIGNNMGNTVCSTGSASATPRRLRAPSGRRTAWARR